MPNVEVVNIYKSYGKIVALKGVSLKIKNKDYVCIIGPSGSGKTTLLKIIAGILQPDKGDVYFDGECVTDLSPEERKIGLVMQEILLFPHMTVWDNVTFSPLVKGFTSSSIVRIGKEIINYLDLTLSKRMYPNELSRGVQQKVALARALASNPSLLLLDEPLGSLDAYTAKVLRYELKQLVKDLGLTAIHITHNQEEALSIADKIVVMRRGKIEQVGTPLELYLSPKTPFISRFIGGEANFFEGLIRKATSRGLLIELKGGTLIETYCNMSLGQRVLVVIKPEHIQLVKGVSWGKTNVVIGRIAEKSFMGAYIRYRIETEEGDIIVKSERRQQFEKGETATLILKKVFVFEYPKEGVNKAIAYE